MVTLTVMSEKANAPETDPEKLPKIMEIVAELGAERSQPGWGKFCMDLNEDQKQIKEWVHEFAANEMRPAGEEWDEKEEFPWPVVKKAAEIGLYGLEAQASMMLDPTGMMSPIMIEELFWGDAGIALSIVGSGLAAAAIQGQGTPEQVDKWLPRCYGTAENPQVAAFCSSEPNAGSDVSGMRTTAVYDAATDEWVLNGSKSWATNGGVADVHVVTATVDPTLGSRAHAAFVVPMSEIAGISQGAKVKKHGIKASQTTDVNLDDARVPGSYLLGGKEKLDARLEKARTGGSSKSNASMKTFETTRPAVGAMALGIARAAYEYALDYAKEREQFGRKIIENQAIAFKLANMKTELDAARLLVWRASWMAAGQFRGENVEFNNAEGSMAKYKASEMAVKVTEEAIQILGGNGYTREYPVERFHRDSKIMTIFEGTSEIQQLVIGRAISGMRIQ